MLHAASFCFVTVCVSRGSFKYASYSKVTYHGGLWGLSCCSNAVLMSGISFFFFLALFSKCEISARSKIFPKRFLSNGLLLCPCDKSRGTAKVLSVSSNALSWLGVFSNMQGASTNERIKEFCFLEFEGSR